MKTVLFPTDFSPGADNALDYVIKLNNKLKAKLLLYNSFYIPAYAGVPIDGDVEDELLNINTDQLNELKKQALVQNETLEIDCVTTYGLAVDNIISTSKEKNVDLIMMGTKGASGWWKEVFIGSNATAVLEKAPCPVLVIPQNAQFKNINKIVFATDFRDSDFYSIAQLTEIASLFKAEIMIVHVSQVAPTEDHEKDLLEWYKEKLKKNANVEYENIFFHDLVGGNVDFELENFIEKNKVDLLALSMRKRNIFSKLFERSFTKKMMYHTQIPLLGFHHLR